MRKHFALLLAALLLASMACAALAEAAGTPEAELAALEDGVYTVDVSTGSSMFHINEAYGGKGTLTVQDGEMTVHIVLASKNIVNLFYGLAQDARQEGAELIEPTMESVTYSDGYTEDAYAFDLPVPALDEEYDVAIIGTKGNWYDHRVAISNPIPAEEGE